MSAHVYYIGKTSTGYKVEHRNYEGWAENVFTKDATRYFYGDDALSDAENYAHKKAGEWEQAAIKRHPSIQL